MSELLDIHPIESAEEAEAAARLTLKELLDSPNPTAEDVTWALDNACAMNQTRFVACDEKGEIVGVAGLAHREGRDWGLIVDVATAAARRRTGIGRALLSAIERAAQEKDVITLKVISTNQAAPFYEALGYERDRVSQIYTKVL